MAEASQQTAEKFSWDAAARQILDLAEGKIASKARTAPVARKRRVLYVVPYNMAGGGEVWVREAIRRLDRDRSSRASFSRWEPRRNSRPFSTTSTSTCTT